jgi:arginyl-tRNA synthetase
VAIDPLVIARHMIDNPAYAVRYAHARAASGERWAAAVSRGDDPPYSPMRWLAGPMKGEDIGPASQRGYLGNASSGVLVLLDALSWLPERVATAARRGRPDEFARYLEELARATIVALISPGDPGSARAPGTDRLSLARAARTGLAAGLALLEVSAPDRV